MVAPAREKEPCYFTDFGKREWAGPFANAFASVPRAHSEYDALFDDGPGTRWRLDASTDYMWCPGAAQRIARFAAREDVADIRIIAVLRDPVARVVSEYQHTLRAGMESLDLTSAMAAEADRIAAGWHPLFYHRHRSLYAEHLPPWFDLFGDRILVLDHHQLWSGKDEIRRVASFLDLDDLSPAQVLHMNKGHVPRSRLLSNLLHSPKVKAVARRLVPQGLRRAAWTGMDRRNRTSVVVTERERAIVRQQLADAIADCVADPRLPTDHWTTDP